MPCQNYDYLDYAGLLDRRQMFSRVGTGLAGIALASLMSDELKASTGTSHPISTGQRAEPAQYAPRAKAVIQFFQNGGPSHMDLFDPKPELNKQDGKPMPKSFTDLVKISQHGALMGTPWKFRPHGESGVPYSEIIPHIASCADDIAVIRSMFSEHNNHEQAIWHMMSGRPMSARPTIGAWVNYALGSENQDLPAYIVLRHDSSLPINGVQNWTSGFLPPKYQGVHFRHNGPPVMNLHPTVAVSDSVDQLRRGLLRDLNQSHRQANPAIDSQLEARIASYEMAARMQISAARALDLQQETKATQSAYGLDNPTCASYGRRCLIARRLIERGVRYVQIMIHGQIWDTHGNNAIATKGCCDQTDQPVGALLKDLKQRGLLDSTLLLWGGEFGRTPVSQGGSGRDHHKQGFSVWMAGGGIKGGQTYGETDDLGYHAVDKRVQVADLHATMLHLLGLNHKKVAFRMHGRDERLTDVYDAKVLTPLIA